MHLLYTLREFFADILFGPPCALCWQRRCKGHQRQAPTPTPFLNPPRAGHSPHLRHAIDQSAADLRRDAEAKIAAAFRTTNHAPLGEDLAAPWIATVEKESARL